MWYRTCLDEEGFIPDLQKIGKRLGGGYVPVAGMLIVHQVVGVLQRGTSAFAHGQIYQGYLVASAALLVY